jgi:hypothetical protein
MGNSPAPFIPITYTNSHDIYICIECIYGCSIYDIIITQPQSSRNDKFETKNNEKTTKILKQKSNIHNLILWESKHKTL